MEDLSQQKKCSSCKKIIALNQKYYVCSVSTCNGQRTGYSFCSVPCFESHLPGARHRDAGAVERIHRAGAAPSTGGSSGEVSGAGPSSAGGVRRIIASGPAVQSSFGGQQKVPLETLIVASKLKDYIRAKSDMNTSASVMDVLSDIVRRECDKAIDKARQEGRKTVLDRDFEKE